MRLLVAALILCVPAIAADAQAAPLTEGVPGTANCPRTTNYLADQSGVYRGKPPVPRKLTELPPATAYMAVMRHIGPCEAPLTMVDYRNPRRR